MIDARHWLQQDIGDEFADAKLGDVRRTRRLAEVARAVEEMPDVGFPQMVESDGELEGFFAHFALLVGAAFRTGRIDSFLTHVSANRRRLDVAS